MITKILTQKKEEFEQVLQDFFTENTFYPKKLDEAIKYTLADGGKRIRPVSLMLSAEFLGVDFDDGLKKLALALEFIHTYSLIHDDLPAMDNDNFRRGKPSCHKVFGEAGAILAGDALLNLAFELSLEAGQKGERYLKAASYLAKNAGALGMIGGQYLDVYYFMKTEECFLEMYDKKTGGLLRSAFIIPFLIAEKPCVSFEDYEEAAKSFALIFQLTDDLLDIDEESNFVKKYGNDRALSLINISLQKIKKVFTPGKGSRISALADYISARTV